MDEDFSGKIYERIALALVVARQKQLGIPILVNIWPRLPREIKLNTIRDAIAVIDVLRKSAEDWGPDGIVERDINRWLAEAKLHIKELGVE